MRFKPGKLKKKTEDDIGKAKAKKKGKEKEVLLI